MVRRALSKLALIALAVLSSAPAAAFGPGEAAFRFQPGRSIRQVAGNVDFKVLFWYRRADPLGTFKYQVYDVRKGEYTAAVEGWMNAVQSKYPGYTAVVRDVDLKREKGETEKLKVGAVIKRELMVVAAFSGVDIGGTSYFSPARPSQPQTVAPGAYRTPPSVSVDRSFLNPSPTPFPVPIPYPRPHP